MDLYLMILRFLFGMPAEDEQVESIVVHADGRTSSGNHWIATQRSIQNIIGASKPCQRLMQSKPTFPGFWQRVSCYLRKEPRLRTRCRDNRRTSRI